MTQSRTTPLVELVDISVPDQATGHLAEPRVARLRDAVLALAPRADQEEFSGRARDTLPVADQDPYRSPFAIVCDGDAAGFGVLDVQGYPDELAAVDAGHASPSGPVPVVLLRAFYVGVAWQGRGIGGAAIRALPEAARKALPGARALALTVNVRNTGATAAYLACGFADTGRLYLGGDAGPQHVLRWALD
ncbi:GNAT family N-acetyltransferase [Yinghuangia seranimata]|uniref:GNAT family N-acetyltransferase n=1 Tax=Yinghuangia seranimata TaxID=408067 RepID=UPI00248B380B|nr:GNAT family N-acetyltransferase [Yinghuangia seranimata]MDI2126854.1 GNAT family N-acetyltransferase [Yinghuangia seranimata]